MASKENRRYPKRFDAEVPIVVQDKAKTKGLLVNLSRDGILVTIRKPKPINSFIRLQIFIPNVPNGVQINGKVVRHTIVNDVQAMGIRFLEMNGTDQDYWMSWIASFSQKLASQQRVSVTVGDKLTPIVSAPREIKDSTIEHDPHASTESTFIIKFKTIPRMEDFFPQDWENEDFFIQTSVVKNRGDKISIRMIHPENERELKLSATVQKYSRHPLKVHKEGIFFRITNFSRETNNKISDFLGIESHND